MRNRNLIYKIAWSFHNTTGIDIQELISEATLAYLKSFKKYNKNKGKFSVFIWRCMESALVNFCKQENKYHQFITELNGYDKGYNPFLPFEEIEELFPQEIKETIQLILDYSDELDHRPKFARGQIVKILRNQGYKWEKIWGDMKIIPELLKQIEFQSIL